MGPESSPFSPEPHRNLERPQCPTGQAAGEGSAGDSGREGPGSSVCGRQGRAADEGPAPDAKRARAESGCPSPLASPAASAEAASVFPWPFGSLDLERVRFRRAVRRMLGMPDSEPGLFRFFGFLHGRGLRAEVEPAVRSWVASGGADEAARSVVEGLWQEHNRRSRFS